MSRADHSLEMILINKKLPSGMGMGKLRPGVETFTLLQDRGLLPFMNYFWQKEITFNFSSIENVSCRQATALNT